MSRDHGLAPDPAGGNVRGGLVPVARGLQALGVTPNAVTVAGFAATLAAAALLVTSGPVVALVPLAIGAAADAVDGTLARLTRRDTPFGNFLDSTLDRVSDAAPFVAAALIATREAEQTTVLLALWAIVVSFLVSYTRAKAESLGLAAAVGVAPREVRIVLLIVGIALWAATAERAFFTYAIALTALLATLTVAQRVAHVAGQRSPNP